MLRLIEWLDTRYLWGRAGEFCLRMTAMVLLLAISGQVAFVLWAKPTNIMRPMLAETYSTVKPRPSGVQSLFKGPRPASHAETLKDATRCLAQAIYFEARSEPVARWEAVADVVINRARDKRYPASICGVVFQGEYRRHKCQFSFACDGRSDRARHRGLWRRALRVAETKLLRYDEVRSAPTARATHYHADYVAPYWSKKMVRLTKIGRHIFYSDRAL